MTATVTRMLHDGASLEIGSVSLGVTTIGVRDADGEIASVSLERAAVRQVIADLELIAGLRPTTTGARAALALAGAVRRNFELLGELDKTDPAAVDLIVASMLAHLRSWRPMLLTAGVQL